MEKFEEVKGIKETQKTGFKEPEVLTIYTKRIDKNSLYALKVALPVSKIRILHLANNDFTLESFEVLVDCVLNSAITNAHIDWNPLPKCGDPSKEYPFAKLYILL